MAAYVAGPWIPASAGMTVGGGCHTLKGMVWEPDAAYFDNNDVEAYWNDGEGGGHDSSCLNSPSTIPFVGWLL